MLTVAVTGPTGDIGRAFLHVLEDSDEITRVRAMARRPFDPMSEGLSKVEYIQGDVTDRAAVEKLVSESDVVAHLAFQIFGGSEQARKVNIEGSRHVFEAARDAGAKRLVYTSSIAAYGFHEDHPEIINEEVDVRGSAEHHYSMQKAEVEKLLSNLASTAEIDVYVLRPCIVAGSGALALIERIPYVQLGEKLPGPVRQLIDTIPLLRPVIPDPGVSFQLVHEDDVAEALLLATIGRGEPGAYNVAAEGEITLSDLAHALGWYAIPVPELAVDATAKVVSRLPMLPAETRWVSALKTPVIIDCGKARAKLGWKPRHDALETLAQTVQSAREQGLIPGRPGGI
jgi:UDP-glucose 4-epimerase